jgi:hypothetical protein
MTRRFFITAMALLLVAGPAPAAEPRPSRVLPARQRVRDAKRYYCYYGAGRVEELARYDVVILHAPAATPETVRALKDRGVVTIGYITCGEDLTVRIGDGTGPGGKASWYFDKDKDGQPDTHPIWKSIFTNAGDRNWRDDRVAEAKRLVNEVGFDGIFLDTVDDVSIYPETFEGMARMIEEFRRALPDAPIVMNQSWELMVKVAPVIDGVMLEGFSTSYDFASKTHRRNPPSWDDAGLARVKKYVEPTRKAHPFQVFVLDYVDPQQVEFAQQAADRAATFGFLHCLAPMALDAVYHINVTGRSDPKWLQRQTTPESMSVTLDKARNGFDAGTQVLPSSCFSGYTVGPIVDGIAERAKLDWSQAAWASAEDGESPWLEVRLPAAKRGGALRIEWEPSHASRDFAVQTKVSDSSEWRDAVRVTDNRDAVVSVTLPTEPYRFIRIQQDANGGGGDRPGLMWVQQIKWVP